MQARALTTVPHPDDMDDDTFCKHMNLRHLDSLGGLSDIWAVDIGTTEAWRAFHSRLHSLRVDLAHDHQE